MIRWSSPPDRSPAGSVRVLRWTLITLLALGAAAPFAAGPIRRWRFERGEDARLHAHFSQVLAELAARPLPGLAPAARAGRMRLLALLAEYDRAGRFPRNEGQCARRTPIFVDRHGTRCAMAWLVEHTGGRALVARIAATANLARIRELAGDRDLQQWLAAEGLDLAEAARIQPEYPPGPPLPPKVFVGRSKNATTDDYFPSDRVMGTVTMASLLVGTPAIALGLEGGGTRAQRVRRSAFGILAGGASTAVGLIDLTHDGHLRLTGQMQLAIGATALTLGVLDLRAPRGPKPVAAGRTRVGWRPGLSGEPQLTVALRF